MWFPIGFSFFNDRQSDAFQAQRNTIKVVMLNEGRRNVEAISFFYSLHFRSRITNKVDRFFQLLNPYLVSSIHECDRPHHCFSNAITFNYRTDD